MAHTEARGVDIDLEDDPADYEPRRHASEPGRRHARGRGGESVDTSDNVIDRPGWTDPRFLVPVTLFLAAVFVIGLALRADNIAPGATDAERLVADVVAAEQRAGFSDITVRAEDSLIVLEGTAESTVDAIAMGAVAKSVEGVSSVDNRLVIEGGALDEQITTPPAAAPAPGAVAGAGAETLSGQLAAAGNVTFEPASAELTAEGTATVDAVADLLLANPGVRVEIHGHTDSDGDEVDNQVLSQNRAEAVVEALRQRGVDERLLTPVGFGESQPIEPNITPEGRAKNRRIEFAVVP